MGNVPGKKVVNADTGDADHFGGNDIDDIQDFLNDQDKTGPVKINTEFWFRDGKLKFRDSGNDHLYIHNFANLAANRNINWPLLAADDEPLFKTFAATLNNKTLDIKDNTLGLRHHFTHVFKVGSTYYAKKYDGTLISSSATFETVFAAAIALKGVIFMADSERSVNNFTEYNCSAGTEFILDDATYIIGESPNVAILVPDGYTGNLFKISPTGAGSYTNIRNISVGEQGTPDRNWTAFKYTMGSGKSASLQTPLDNVVIYNASVGVELETTHSTAFLNSLRFNDVTIYGTRTGFLFDQTAGDIDQNMFTNCNVQATTAVTTTGFKDIDGTNNLFIGCSVWDPDDSATECNIKATADGTMIYGGRMTGGKGHFIDLGTKTLLIDSGNIVTSRLLTRADLAKTGQWVGSASTNGDGILNGRLAQIEIGTGSAASNTVDSTGMYRTMDTGATVNSLAGYRSSVVLTRRANNAYFKTAIYLNDITATRVFAGLTSSGSAPSSAADPLANLSGVGLWFDSAVSANWKRGHNDGDATGDYDDTTIAAATATLYPIEVYAVGDTKWRIVALGQSTDITTEIPSSTSNQAFWVYIENTAGDSKTMRIYYLILKTDG